MNMSLPFTNIRSFVANEFYTLRTRARRDTLFAKLTGKNRTLARFPDGLFQTGPNRKLIGIKDIPVEKITGTLYRHSDFDHQFRPLKKNLRDRWVNIYLLHEREGWSPILVHKVADHYYVEDGHHRVSVARALGITFIQAKIWEYPSRVKQTKKCKNVKSLEKNSLKKYVPITE